MKANLHSLSLDSIASDAIFCAKHLKLYGQTKNTGHLPARLNELIYISLLYKIRLSIAVAGYFLSSCTTMICFHLIYDTGRV